MVSTGSKAQATCLAYLVAFGLHVAPEDRKSELFLALAKRGVGLPQDFSCKFSNVFPFYYNRLQHHLHHHPSSMVVHDKSPRSLTSITIRHHASLSGSSQGSDADAKASELVRTECSRRGNYATVTNISRSIQPTVSLRAKTTHKGCLEKICNTCWHTALPTHKKAVVSHGSRQGCH